MLSKTFKRQRISGWPCDWRIYREPCAEDQALGPFLYEASPEVNQFSSKYDYYLKGEVDLTPLEMEGMALFNDEIEGGGKCSLCHPSEGTNALLTDFTYDNLSFPRNPENPFYEMDTVYLGSGDPVNPEGFDWVDPGLGGFLETRSEWAAMAAENMGKHKVPTLRNVDKRTGENFPKAFGRNGYFKSLNSSRTTA
jgi:cytochrome c peroxidase